MMKTCSFLLTILATALLVAPASSQDKPKPSPKEQVEASAKKIKELQKERIATLKEYVDGISGLIKSAYPGVSFETLLEAQMLLHKAELEAAEKESERIAIYKKMIDVLKQFEEVAQMKAKAARGTPEAVLKVKARRLEVEIQLEQAKMKAAKESK